MTAGTGPTTPFLVHLGGPLRGTVHPLRASWLVVGTSPEATIHIPARAVPGIRERHVVLERLEAGYVLRAVEGALVRVNGEPVDRHPLVPGDVVEVGDGGPLLRYRIHAGDGLPRKSLREAVRDCIDCARHERDTPLGRAVFFLGSMPRELLTQTAPWPRTLVLVALTALLTATALLAVRTWTLERRLEAEGTRLRAAAQLLEEAERVRLRPEELERIREGLASNLSERVQALEASREAVPAVIEAASRSVAFIQGAYGFLDPDSGEPLRTAVGPDGRPLTDARGQPIATREGDGPVLEMLFTGTAFVVGTDGLLLTNRHLARPWEYDDAARTAVGRGLIPVMRRMVGYLPDVDEPFPVELAAASESADLALLRGAGIPEAAVPLELAVAPARPGQEVVVLGYPTGIRALLARTNPSFVDTLMRETSLGFWAVARRLSSGGHIAPLATRGIVGQVTRAFVVYDAETTRGGSGGPVLTLAGDVLAVTVGILPGFGGSNLGVPAEEATRLLETVEEEQDAEAGSEEPTAGASGSRPLPGGRDLGSLPDHDRERRGERAAHGPGG